MAERGRNQRRLDETNFQETSKDFSQLQLSQSEVRELRKQVGQLQKQLSKKGIEVGQLQKQLSEAEGKAEEEKRQRVEKGIEVGQLQKQLSEAEGKAEEEKRQRIEKEKLNAGTYFTNYNELWNVDWERCCNEDHLEKLTRDKNLAGVSGIARGGKHYYTRTVQLANEMDSVDSVSSRNSDNTDFKNEYWPQDVLHQGQVQPRKPQGQVAHLVPDSPENASLHVYVAPMVFGIRNASRECEQKLIHGSNKKGTIRRENFVGVRHFPTNKIRLMGQSEYYDQFPHVLIVPTLSVDAAKNWNGQGYDALFLIGEPKNKEGFGLPEIARGTGLNGAADPVASLGDIEVARKLLEASVLALAYSAHKICKNETVSLIKPQTEHISNHIPNVTDPTKPPCPVSLKQENPLVRKISFCDIGSTEGHPAPDPMLLVMKAANNWSAANGMRLLPGEEESSEEDMMSERSLLALEIHMAILKEWKENERNQEICGMEIACVR